MKSNETVKIFVLYLMENVGYPLDYLTVSDMILQTDYVIYLDFAEAFADLQDSGMVKEVGKNSHGEPMYAVTEKGRYVARELKSDLLGTILDQSLARALRYLNFKKRG